MTINFSKQSLGTGDSSLGTFQRYIVILRLVSHTIVTTMLLGKSWPTSMCVCVCVYMYVCMFLDVA